jgi:hypothetical protein
MARDVSAVEPWAKATFAVPKVSAAMARMVEMRTGKLLSMAGLKCPRLRVVPLSMKIMRLMLEAGDADNAKTRRCFFATATANSRADAPWAARLASSPAPMSRSPHGPNYNRVSSYYFEHSMHSLPEDQHPQSVFAAMIQVRLQAERATRHGNCIVGRRLYLARSPIRMSSGRPRHRCGQNGAHRCPMLPFPALTCH